MRVCDLELDSAQRRATRAGRTLDLTTKEFALLSLLMQRAGEVVSRALIAKHVWQADYNSKSNYVEVLVSRVRSKVDDPFSTTLIHTVRGSGYYLAQLYGFAVELKNDEKPATTQGDREAADTSDRHSLVAATERLG